MSGKPFYLPGGTFIWVGMFLRNFKEWEVYSYSCRFVYLAEVSTLMLLSTIIMCKAILRQFETLLF